METTTTTEKLRHPKGLYLISFVTLWERFSFYGLSAFLIYYMTNDPNAINQLGGLGIKEDIASIIISTFMGLCYLLSLPGGRIADRYFGKRKSILIGGFLITAGLLSLASDLGPYTFYGGLAFICFGNGFFKPSASSLVGDLYEQGDKRKDAAYTIFYMVFNGGAFAAPILCGYLNNWGYKFGFLAIAIGMIVGMIVYVFAAQKFLGDAGKTPIAKPKKDEVVVKQPLTKEEKQRISVIFIVILFVTFFWMGFSQTASSLALYTRDFIDRSIFNWEVPAEWFQSVNPLLILFLGAPFSALWIFLAKRKKDPSIPVKMGLGMIILGAGFLFMVGAVIQRGGDNTDPTAKASLIFLIMTYLFHTIGELCVSPIGLSMISKLAPQRMTTFFMGTWFLSIFLAYFIGGFMVSFINSFGAFSIFSGIAIFVAALGVIVLLISKRLVTMMHGIK
ncbi:MAG: peptide MFS transporter [Bacteroidota bacterium]